MQSRRQQANYLLHVQGRPPPRRDAPDGTIGRALLLDRGSSALCRSDRVIPTRLSHHDPIAYQPGMQLPRHLLTGARRRSQDDTTQVLRARVRLTIGKGRYH